MQRLLVVVALICGCCVFFFFQAEDGIRDAQESRGLGDVYKRQLPHGRYERLVTGHAPHQPGLAGATAVYQGAGARPGLWGRHVCARPGRCLLYTSDAADDLLCVDLGGRRILKKKKKTKKKKKKINKTRKNKIKLYSLVILKQHSVQKQILYAD